jgi:polysaccharide biosynthesis protein PslG
MPSNALPLPVLPGPGPPAPALPLPGRREQRPWYRARAAAFLAALLIVAVVFGGVLLGGRITGTSAGAKTARTASLHAGIAYGDELTFMRQPALNAALNDAKAVGAHWVRADLSWADVQRSSPDAYDWSGFDRIVAGANARGLRVLPVLAYTPAWARPSGCDSQSCRPASDAAFARFASAAVDRYAPRGVHTWEIWNEPNSSGFWQPAPSAGDYATLLRATVHAIRDLDDEAFIVSGGLAAVSTRNGDIAQIDFLRRLSALGGNKLVNAIGYHPYTYPLLPSLVASFHTPWDRIDRAPVSLRSVLQRYGTPDLPFWLTEYGAPTGGPGSGSSGAQNSSTTHVTETRQAQILVDAVNTAWRDENIQGLFIYEDKDAGGSRATNENFYGIRRANGAKKPAFLALRKALLSLGSGVG